MNPPPTASAAEHWCRDTAWVRRLARSLIAHPDDADEVAQEAWLRALHADPPRAGFRAWMAAVVRNAARARARSDLRRRAREAAAAREPTAPATDDRLDEQELLLTTVRALDEPYRATVVLRYFQDLPPREIAARTGVPVRTVHTRLHRALGLLRQALDDRHGGDRRAWAAPLLAIAGRPRPSLLLAAMNAKTTLVAIALVAAAVLVPLALSDPTVPAAADAPAATRTAEAPPTAGAVAAAREPAVVPPPEPSAPTAAPAEVRRLDGLVVDVDGRPLSGVALQVIDMFDEVDILPSPTHSDAEGRFAVAVARRPGMVRAADPEWATVLEAILFDHDDHRDLVVMVAPAIEIAGEVVDEDGAAVPDAQLAVDPGHPLRSLPGRVLDRCRERPRDTRSDARGRFRLRAPRFADGHLFAHASGFDLIGMPAPQVDTAGLRVVLRRKQGDFLAGTVVDRDGLPAADALVSFGGTWSRSDAAGGFRIALADAHFDHGAAVELRALRPGAVSARVVARDGVDWRSRAAWPEPLVLRLGGSPLSIRGRVVRADGTPVPSPQVLAPCGHQVIPDTLHFQPDGIEMSQSGSEDVDAAAGEFELRGLDPGGYRLRVLDPESRQAVVTEPIAAGSDGVLVRLPDAQLWPALRGIVVDRRGDPVAGADWSLLGDAPAGWGEAKLNGDFRHADGDGRIAYPALARSVHTLLVKGPGMADWERILLRDLARVDDFRVVVPVGVQAQVVLADAGEDVDSVGFIDLAGRTVPVVVTHGDTAWGTRDVALTAGASQTFMAPDDLAELVLRKGGREVRRSAVTVRRGQLNVLRP